MVHTVWGDAAKAGRWRAHADGKDYWRTPFLTPTDGRLDKGVIEPMAFLVEQDPDTTVSAHYHQADQFQVAVGGSGWLGRHAVRTGSVHYANAFSPYGPVAAGPEGLDYFTLRNGWDPGAQFLPGAIEALTAHKPKSNRQAMGDDFDLPSADALQALHEGVSRPVIASEPDGLGAWLHLAGPDGEIAGQDPQYGYGQFWVVLLGSLGAEALPPRSCVFVTPEEPALATRAGFGGVAVLELQFPDRGWATP